MALRARLWLANALIGSGLLLLAGSTGLYAYGLYERYLFEQQPPVEYVESAAALVEPVELPPIQLEPVEAVDPAEPAAETVEMLPDALPEDRWQLVPIRPEPPLKFPPATRIVIPSIKVDSRVVEAKIVGDTWEVPKFVVGHLEGTAPPGAIGNAAFSGHVESISSGNVFAQLENVKKGDEIVVYLGNNPRRYKVTELKVVRNTDVSIVASTPDERITLITCTGTWLPLARDYDRRRIVIARPVDTPTPPWVPTPSGP